MNLGLTLASKQHLHPIIGSIEFEHKSRFSTYDGVDRALQFTT